VAVPGTFDVLLLGGGTAGCALAGRLSEDPDLAVCLVEAGPDYGPRAAGRWPEDMLDARILPFSHSWGRLDESDRSQHRARIIGGCSSHNACIVLEGAPEDYDEWGHGWSHAELKPYLDRARAALGTRQTQPGELSPWHAALAEAAGADAILHPVNADGAVP
jgi:choline dehydrogenase